MLHSLTVPKWGLSMERAAVRAWLVNEGSEVEVGTSLVEIESEKIANELQSECAGVVRRILAPVGTLVAVGEPLAVIASEGESDATVEEYVRTLAISSLTDKEQDDSGPKRAQVRVGTHALSYLLVGAAQPKKLPAVLVHGFGGDSTTWQLNAPVLAAQRPVYALDLPGHGSSSRELESGSLEELLIAVSGFATELSLERFHLVGHSLGAAIALQLAKRQPARIASLTLLSPAGLGVPVDPGFIDRFARAASRKDIKQVLEQLFEDRSLITPELIEKVQQGRRLDGARQALERIAASNFKADEGFVTYDPAELKDVATRTLVVAGDKDRVIPFGDNARPTSDVRFEVLKGVGHMPQLEASQAVNSLLESIFAAHDAWQR